MPRRPFAPVFWSLAQVGSRVRFTPPATKVLDGHTGPEEELSAATRHGPTRLVVLHPPSEGHTHREELPPLLVHLHGGGFLNRFPEQDRFIARHLAAALGAVVVMPDYVAAPAVRYPVAEEQAFDVVTWLLDAAQAHRWDSSRLLLSGISAGAKLALNVCQQLHATDGRRPVGMSLIVPVTDMSRNDRRSTAARPAISPFVQRLVQWAYFPDADRRREPLAAPRFDPSLADAVPTTLIQTAELDTLAPEGRELAESLRAGGVRVRLREHPGVDHGLYSQRPVQTIALVFAEVVTHLRSCLEVDDDTHRWRAHPPA